MSVEHFAPAKWKESWNELENETYIDLNEKFSKDLSGKNLDDSYLIQHHKNEDDPQKNGPKNDNFILEHIGNKLWLKQPTNSSLGAKSFNRKKKIIKERSVIYLPNQVEGLDNVENLDSYKLSTILQRSKKILSYFNELLISNKPF